VPRTVEEYLKNAKKCCVLIWLRPRYKIPEFFTIAPVLTSTLTVCHRNRGDPSSLCRTSGALQVLQKNIVVLIWPGAAHAPIAVSVGPQVYSVQQYVCAKIFPDRLKFGSTRAKNQFLSKNRERQALAWPSINKFISYDKAKSPQSQIRSASRHRQRNTHFGGGSDDLDIIRRIIKPYPRSGL